MQTYYGRQNTFDILVVSDRRPKTKFRT